MFVEVTFRILHFLSVNQTHMPYPALSKTIHERSAQIASQTIVHQSSDDGSNSGTNDHEEHVQFACGSGFVGCWRYYHFAWKWNETALDCHQECDDPVVQVLKTPCYEGNGLH